MVVQDLNIQIQKIINSKWFDDQVEEKNKNKDYVAAPNLSGTNAVADYNTSSFLEEDVIKMQKRLEEIFKQEINNINVISDSDVKSILKNAIKISRIKDGYNWKIVLEFDDNKVIRSSWYPEKYKYGVYLPTLFAYNINTSDFVYNRESGGLSTRSRVGFNFVKSTVDKLKQEYPLAIIDFNEIYGGDLKDTSGIIKNYFSQKS